MELFDVARILVLGLKWLVYTGLLWGMLRVQKLNYNLLGLFGSSLLATLVALIPVVGSYLSYVVLIVCLWKCTGADIAPDITFTVGISGALMFCVNLFVIGALMGRLRPDLASDHGKGASAAEQARVEEEEDFDETADGPAPTHSHASPSAGGHPRGTPARPGAGSVTASARSGPAAPAPSSPFTIKGTSFGTARPSVLISDGTQVHTVRSGESFTATLGATPTRFRCDSITRSNVVLRNGDGRIVQLVLP